MENLVRYWLVDWLLKPRRLQSERARIEPTIALTNKLRYFFANTARLQVSTIIPASSCQDKVQTLGQEALTKSQAAWAKLRGRSLVVTNQKRIRSSNFQLEINQSNQRMTRAALSLKKISKAHPAHPQRSQINYMSQCCDSSVVRDNHHA